MEYGSRRDHVEDSYIRASFSETFCKGETATSGATCDQGGSAFECELWWSLVRRHEGAELGSSYPDHIR